MILLQASGASVDLPQLDTSTLQVTVASLHSQINALTATVRESLDASHISKGVPIAEQQCQPSERSEMNETVESGNRYSRLMALQTIGIVQDYNKIQSKRIAIIGVGGVGSAVSDMLTRCGIGELFLFDRDKVEMANLNRTFYFPHQVGMCKVDAAQQSLSAINPQVAVSGHNIDISCTNGMQYLSRVLNGAGNSQTSQQGMPSGQRATSKKQSSGTKGSNDNKQRNTVDLVIACVDSFQARIAINQVCLDNCIQWIECGVSDDGMSGHVQLIQPGVTACYQCVPPYAVASNIKEDSANREGACSASIPTTMCMVACQAVQTCLKIILNFGVVSPLTQLNLLNDHNTTIGTPIKPSKECTNQTCQQKQGESAKLSKLYGNKRDARVVGVSGKHSELGIGNQERNDNPWGILVIGEGQSQAKNANSATIQQHEQQSNEKDGQYGADLTTMQDASINHVIQSLDDLQGQLTANS